MATSRVKKHEIVDFLKSDVASQKSVVLVSTKGAEMTVNAQSNFDVRKAANDNGIGIKVVKNSLLETSFGGIKNLSGQTYVAYLNDASQSNEVIVPKLFIKMVDKEFKNKFNLIGAIINGEFVDAATAMMYSEVATHEESMGQIAGLLNNITAKIALTIKEIPTSTVRAIDAVAKAKA